ncbi:prepilin-type N-terminal cleavage/methylation domain-containing protein [Sulfurospirillum sp. 1612]|uniref:prepilin-type N-terminal cleavage/methylation domain-containing protein n=1 Tax=Sulfurospirillum sp. 1612 TaxID=3094835 RepID=UPI002F94DBD8
MKKHQYTHRAFTILELIFVIILIGIISSIGLSSLPDNRLLNDTNFVIMKIKETQRHALGNDVIGFNTPWSVQSDATCLDVNNTSFEEKARQNSTPFQFVSDVSSENKRLCFDEFGRPYHDEKLIQQKLDINITYNHEMNTISVQPMSGYVIIKN